MDVKLYRVSSSEDVLELAAMADDIWHEYFVSILSEDQIEYMVDQFQSAPAMTKQMVNQGYEYYFIMVNQQIVGYTGIKNDGNKLFLSKLYLKKEHRGKHYATAVMDQLKEICAYRGQNAIWLTVNRFNLHTIAVYQSFGFESIRTQVTDIGEGYVMDDYIMEVKIGQEKSA